ncbi:MAG: DUF6503 family protein [Salinivenus sp.]
MRLLAATLTSLLLLFGCQSGGDDAPDRPSAAAIVDSAVAAHGGAVLDRAVVSFVFRGDQYRIRQDEGQFHYRRTYTDSLDQTITDGLTNDGVYRVVDGDTVALSEDERGSVRTTVNSVSYFALLPHPLGDSAVQPEYSGRDTIDGTPYHRIRVTFQQEGGGQDWEDIFMYWFRTDTYAMDYLSYAFGLAPTDTDTGTRFREAYNVRRVEGVRFADYRNYTSDTLSYDRMALYPDLWARDALELVSRIEIDSLQVQPLAPDA